MLQIVCLSAIAAGAIACSLLALSIVRAQRIADRNALIGEAAGAPGGRRRRAEPDKEARSRIASLSGRLAVQAAAAVASFAIVAPLSSSAPAGAVAAAAALVGARLYVSSRIRKRKLLLEEQFGRVCSQIAGSIRTGLSVDHAIRSASAFVDDPLREEFVRVGAETRHSADVAAALYRMAERTGCRDVAYFASAVDLNQRRGGKLADMVDRLAETVATRQEMRALIRSESASGKSGAKAVVGITAFLIAFQFASNPENLDFYRSDPIGWVVAAASAALFCIGCAWMYRIVDIRLD